MPSSFTDRSGEQAYNFAVLSTTIANILPFTGHPKTVLFFTHCGMHGVLEALHHGVPMVGMPVFADQQDVLVRLEERGVARGVSKQADQDQIYDALRHVLTNAR